MLQKWVRARTQRHRTVVRGRIVLMAARGLPVSTIAAHLHVTPATVRLWCRRFETGGLTSLERDAPGRGRPRGIAPERVRAVLRAMRELRGTPLTARRVAASAGSSATTVWRVRVRFGWNETPSNDEIDNAIAQLISETRVIRRRARDLHIPVQPVKPEQPGTQDRCACLVAPTGIRTIERTEE